jgi:thiosulfate dehydrogenase
MRKRLPAPSAAPSLKLVKDGKPVGTYRVPSLAELSAEPEAARILQGMRLLDDTARLLPGHVGAPMDCNSCHLSGGRQADSVPYLNTALSFPGYNPRAARIITLEDRINGCFLRSMNGTPLDDRSPEMRAIVAYMSWLSAKVPQGAKVAARMSAPINTKLTPDPAHGAQVYAARCASCHGGNGEGGRSASGDMVAPPLWGDGSFNIGAGMARLYTAAAFVKGNMPLSANATRPLGQGGLDDQDALDVAQYFTHMPRPDFPPKVNDWPKGGKPADARY